MLEQCSSKCSDCVVAGIVEHGMDKACTQQAEIYPHLADRPRDRQDMDSGNCGIFHAGFLSLSRKRTSKQASCEERILLFFTACYKQWAVRIVGTGVEASSLGN